MKGIPMISRKSLCRVAVGGTLLLWNSPVSATLADYQTAITNQTSLLSYYTFDQSSANDSLGAHNGAVFGNGLFQQGIGNAGKALQFDGTVRVDLGMIPDFDFGDGTGSVEAWIEAGWSGTLTYNPALFANRDGGPVTWSIHMNGDKGAVGMWNGNAYRTLAIPNPGTNWHHLAMVFDTGNMTLFWDGVSMGTLSQELGPSPQSTQMGSSSASVTTEGWVGALDEVAFYADALSPDAVQAHYLALFAGTPPVITTQPRGGTFLDGVALQLEVAATGPNLSYQWYKGSNSLPGETGPRLSFPNLSAANAGTYHVTVANPAGSVPSQDATIAVTASLPAQLITYQKAITNESSLIAYYRFDQLNANDSVGSYPGTLEGTAAFAEGIGGEPAQGLWLDGAGHVGLGPVPDFDFSDGTGSVEAWVRADWPGTLSYNPALFADRDGILVTWSVHMNSDKKAVGMWNGMAYQTLPIPAAGTTWHHLVVVYDSGNMTIYWDGAFLGTLAQGLGLSPETTQLGSSSSSLTTEGWVGMLDEVAFYADALSADAVLAHYKAFLGGTPPEITVQPVGGAFYTGQPLQLSVGATGAELSYQWFKDGTAIAGATGAILDFPRLAVTNAGVYQVTLSNPAGTTNSAATLVQVGNDLASYRKAVTNESTLMSYYTFDASDAADAKGAHSGTVMNQVGFGPGVGLGTDLALVLDGTGHISLGQVADFDFANDAGTVECWLAADYSDPGYDPCVFANRIASTLEVNWSIHMGRARNVIGNWNGLFFQTLPISNTSGWHHYAVAFGGGRVSMYWDGQPLGTFAQPIHLTIGLPTQIGSSDPDTTTEGWIGGIDEVAFYGGTLSADAIRSHFLAMVAPGASPVTGPKISLSLSGNQITLSWPGDAVGFTLESTDKLPNASWLPVPGVVGNKATLQTTGAGQFYRLRK